MKLKLLKKTVLTGLTASSLLLSMNSYAQANDSTAAKPQTPVKPFVFNLNESGSNYVKINFTAQMWGMANTNNPNSAFGSPAVATPESYQLALRRVRLSILSQVTDRVFIFGQIGSDGITSLTAAGTSAGARAIALQYLDITTEYKFGRFLSLGAGLNGWDGLSRYSNPSVPSVLGLDMPLYQQATSNITDNTVRMPGIFGKGKLGKLDYRVSVDIPYSPSTTTAFTQTLTTAALAAAETNPQNASTTSSFATNSYKPQFQGYFMYQFLDEESNLTPGTVGSYLGQKRVFNIGAGFRYQQNAMWHGTYSANKAGIQVMDTVRTNMFLWSADVFYDAPLNKEKGTALTVYGAFSVYDFGQDYIRNNNPLNPASGAAPGTVASFNGVGNQYPMIGTGSIGYVQAGYLMPRFKNGTQFQPYGQLMDAHYNALTQNVVLWDLGVNYLIKGHNSKLSFDYQSRPIYNVTAGTATTSGSINESASARRGMCVLQYQISF